MRLFAFGFRLGGPEALLLVCLALPSLALPSVAHAESYRDIQKRKPDLFHRETGLRIARQRAPIPDDIPPPTERIEARKAASLLAGDAIALDVFGALQSRYDELDGTWLVGKERLSLPGAVWLPETGRGALAPDIRTYLKNNLERLTQGDRDRPLVVFCVSDCWMSWNASQHIAALGYRAIFWFALGTDGWVENGGELVPVDPVPVDTE